MKDQVELTTFMSQVNTLVKLARTKLLTHDIDKDTAGTS